jgi:hypothetical protein
MQTETFAQRNSAEINLSRHGVRINYFKFFVVKELFIKREVNKFTYRYSLDTYVTCFVVIGIYFQHRNRALLSVFQEPWIVFRIRVL